MSGSTQYKFTLWTVITIAILLVVLAILTAPTSVQSYKTDDDGDVIMEDAFEAEDSFSSTNDSPPKRGLDLNLGIKPSQNENDDDEDDDDEVTSGVTA